MVVEFVMVLELSARRSHLDNSLTSVAGQSPSVWALQKHQLFLFVSFSLARLDFWTLSMIICGPAELAFLRKRLLQGIEAPSHWHLLSGIFRERGSSIRIMKPFLG